jgi:Tfp pilus assembly protein PilF
LEEQAILMSRTLVYQREQARLKTIEEAKLHYNLGCGYLTRGDYTAAVNELETARYLKPSDVSLTMKIETMYDQAKKAANKKHAKAAVQTALDNIDREDYEAAGKKLQESLESVQVITDKAQTPAASK